MLVRARRCRCGGSLNHTAEGEAHFAPASASQPGAAQLCMYQERLRNRIYTCRTCYERNGKLTPLSKKMAPAAYAGSTGLALASYLWQGCAPCIIRCNLRALYSCVLYGSFPNLLYVHC